MSFHVRTLCGGADRGFRDGNVEDALFDRPVGAVIFFTFLSQRKPKRPADDPTPYFCNIS